MNQQAISDKINDGSDLWLISGKLMSIIKSLKRENRKII